MRQILLDTETTGLSAKDGHRIIEVAAVEMINRKLTGNHYHQYICPQRPIDQGAVDVHGLTEAFLSDKPLFSHISTSLFEFIQGAELIIHNAPFDISFLDYEFQKITTEFSIRTHCGVIDTLTLARKKHPGVPNNLDALCRRYEIDNSNRQLHGALLDANLLAAVYLAMTGGQTSLFGEASAISTAKQVNMVASLEPVKTFNLKVIAANTEELNLHTGQLAKICEANAGNCLWAQMEAES